MLPTKMNLVHRKIIEKADYAICGAKESVLHAVWVHPIANDVYGKRNSPLSKWTIGTLDFRSLWLEMV